MTWLGHGPHESYPDRLASAPLRQHASSVADMHVPYVFPQESGGRAGVRWAALQPSGGGGVPGLAVCATRGSRPMQMNVGGYGARQLHEARHDHELPLLVAAGARCSPPVVHVHMDHAHMGVGGDDSWSPSVHEGHLVPPAVYSFSLALCPLLGRGGELMRM